MVHRTRAHLVLLETPVHLDQMEKMDRRVNLDREAPLVWSIACTLQHSIDHAADARPVLSVPLALLVLLVNL